MKVKIKEYLDFLLKKKYQLVILLAIIVCLCFYLGISAAILWFIFLFFILYDLDNRFVGGVAIGFLIACPALLFLKKDVLAEESAIYVFFFLVMTVFLQIVEMYRHPERFDKNEDYDQSK